MPLLPDLSAWLTEAAAKHEVPGAAVAVGVGDDLAEAATGVLNRDTGVETTPASLFQIGSAGKVWTAALVMQLADDGLIELDQPVRRYLPDFAVASARAAETVTVRQLLLHTGGFDGDVFEDTGRGDDALDRYLAILHDKAGQVFPPGTHFSYCNSGYSVLGALVARLRGATWETVTRERLVEPLGMRHTALFAEEAILFRAAAGHVRGEVVPRWQFPRSIGPAGGAPAVAPRDLVRLGRMFLAGGTASDGTRLLSADAVTAMTSPQLTLPGVAERGARQRGLGPVLFDWDGTPAYGHDGDTIGQATLWRVVPGHDLVIAVGANSASSTGLFDDLLDAIVAEVTGRTVPARPTPPVTPPRPGPQRYAGRYEFPLAVYDVVATDSGFDVTSQARGIAAALDENPATDAYVHLSGSTYITAEPVDGSHSTLTFLDDGRYLYGGRVAARVSGALPGPRSQPVPQARRA
ncbi:serine hydrolase [Paractinoplanes deccanensis]|uniref:Serine hydrolase n=1 Tax=Paractinoplanes deccanensis TaxID=113561 RepID=A0ABQ3Y3G9_9ACTN|nr:serine hydrolase domain-containing protein [Actinoplanes deccanensis]GID74536.1 serine hydrolase [Actinoplanes deccanensis]